MSTPKRFRFTNQLIKSLPPNTSDARSTDAEYSDTEISGLKCLVSRREGRKKFLLRYLYHGRKRAIAIGHWPEVDVNLARQIAIEHKRALATGTDPKQERENKRKELTFDELFGLAPIFPYTFYHLTHYWFAAADIPVANDTPVHYADAIRCNVRRPPQGSLPLLTRRVSA